MGVSSLGAGSRAGRAWRSLLSAGLALLLVGVRPTAAQETESTTEPVLGAASDLLIEGDPATEVRIEAGTRLHEQPHPHATVVTVVDVEMTLTPLERHDGWMKVRFGDRVGWAPPRSTPAAPGPIHPPAEPPPPAAPIAGLTPDAERLAQAVSLLGQPSQVVAAGPFTVYTDVKSRRKRRLPIEAARHLADAYQRRYGLAPQREASFAVIIFDREASYRQFEDSLADLSQLDAEGHAGSGVAALVAAGRTAEEIAALLVHELTHLLNRQTFLALPPPWLEEGMANDLAYCRLDRAGRLEPGTLGGRGFIAEVPGPPDRFGRRRFSGTIHIEGPLASLSLLKRSVDAEDLMPLPELLDLTWREFVDPAGRELRYVESTFFVRYLLDELDGGGFRRFLSEFQSGGSAGAPALLAALGRGWDELTSGFHTWIARHTGRP